VSQHFRVCPKLCPRLVPSAAIASPNCSNFTWSKFPRTSALFTATDIGKLNGFECLPAFVRFDFLTELSAFTGGVSSTGMSPKEKFVTQENQTCSK
jgi:hypothetical protein